MDQSKHKPQMAKKKVKSGCKTCKARRVKCDESRPACRRCVSTGRVCDGYGIWGGGGSPFIPQSNRALSIHCTPVPAGCLSRQEQQYFDWFIVRTAKKFSSLFPSDFWEVLVFQASAQEPSVRHAVVALSAAHRLDSSTPNRSAQDDFEMEQFTLKQYNKAIHCLQNAPMKDTKHTLHVTLITCMIFITLEYLRGSYERGSAHLRYGIQLLSAISAPTPRSAIRPIILGTSDDFAHTALIDSYSGLTIQSAMLGHIPAHMCVLTRDPQTYSLPYEFSSSKEARQSLENLLNRIYCLEQNSNELEDTMIPSEDPQLFRAQGKILADLCFWYKAYDASLARFDKEATQGENLSFLTLRLYYEMAVIMASTCLSPEGEAAYDSYTERFISIMSCLIDAWIHYKDVIKPVNLNSELSKCNGLGFTITSGFIPPTYYTALKCRIPRIRRQAINMLRAAPHQEGAWNGLILADVLEEVLRIEEDGILFDDCMIDEPIMEIPLNPKHPSMSTVQVSYRITDVTVIHPTAEFGEAFMSYKQMLEDGTWATFERRILPGVMHSPLFLSNI